MAKDNSPTRSKAENEFKKLTFYHNEPNKINSLPFNRVDGFAKDGKGTIWVAGAGGLCRFDTEKEPAEAFTAFPYDAPGKYSNFTSIIKLRHQNSLLLSGPNVLSIFDSDVQKWGQLNDIEGYSKKHPITARYLLEPDDQTKFPLGTVLLFTEKSALLSYNYLTGKFNSYPTVNALTATTRYGKIIDNQLWIASDNGLVKLNIRGKKNAIRFGVKEGLPDDVIYSLQADRKGAIWVATSRGICKFDTAKKRFTAYGSGYGLGSSEFNTAATCFGEDGRLYFGGTNGITNFLPSDIHTNTFSPTALLTGIEVMNKDFPLDENSSFIKKINLNYLENFITLHFAAPNFFQTKKTSYSYKLEGVDRDWENAETRNFATYTDLSQGSYTFQIRSTNSEGIRSANTTSVLVIVEPPFWRTWWFYSLISAAIIAALYAIYKNYQIRKTLQINLEQEDIARRQQEAVSMQKEAHLLHKISETEMMALRSQMNPHFIFNCLNSIKSYALNNDTENVSLYLTRFSKLIRLVLENSQSERINLKNELETLQLYMEMEKLRFGDQFDFEIRLTEDLEPEFTEVPPMLIQPYIENAIWHGLMHKIGKGKVVIALSQPTENSLRITIEDNGIGRTKAKEIKSKTAVQKKSFGMKITSERLEIIRQIYKIDAKVSIDDLSDGAGNPTGTKITLDLPV